ncbi:MAG: hypothetical protein ACP5UI_01415, partial [Thermoprotei archaeon]
SQVSVSLGASAAIGDTSFTYMPIGSSTSGTANNNDVAEVDSVYPQTYTCTKGTIGEAEFQLYQVEESTGAEWPVSPPNYTYEAYVQSCDFNVYRSATAPAFSALYGEITYYPFDVCDLTSGFPYAYAFGSSEQQGADLSLAVTIPIGAIAAAALGVIPVAVLPDLIATVSVTTDFSNLNLLTAGTSGPAYPDVILVSSIDVPYEVNGMTFYPCLQGVNVTQGSYSAPTTMQASGPQDVLAGCSSTYSVLVFINRTDFLVPIAAHNGVQAYISYSFATPYGTFSGTALVTWHSPVLIHIEFPDYSGAPPGYQTEVSFTYSGGVNSTGPSSATYQPSSTTLAVYVEP